MKRPKSNPTHNKATQKKNPEEKYEEDDPEHQGDHR
jgi:hypothetical protein